MSPQVISRKLALLTTYTHDLRELHQAGQVEQNHYAVERLVQVIVEVMYDIVSHWLADQGLCQADSYADVFKEAGERKLITPQLAASLARAGRMRNLLVHMYEAVDLQKLQAAIPQALSDVDEFTRQVQLSLK